MSNYMEFTGKTLNDAIEEACRFYNVPRGKLEIEIVRDARAGFLKLLGNKKAVIRAKRSRIESLNLGIGTPAEQADKTGLGKQLDEIRDAGAIASEHTPVQRQVDAQGASFVGKALPRSGAAPSAIKGGISKPSQGKFAAKSPRKLRNETGPEELTTARHKGRKFADLSTGEGHRAGAGRADSAASATTNPDKKQFRVRANKSNEREASGVSAGVFNNARSRGQRKPQLLDDSFTGSFFPEIEAESSYSTVSLSSIDKDELVSAVGSIVDALTAHVSGCGSREIEVLADRVLVRLDDLEDSGLLIGKDGQTLAALQYLVSCMVSRKLGASVHVHLDAANYRERQDDKLRELALDMARKVKEERLPQATRLMGAYQRRVIHMTLQNDPEVQTHSKGDGSLKRVVVLPRREQV